MRTRKGFKGNMGVAIYSRSLLLGLAWVLFPVGAAAGLFDDAVSGRPTTSTGTSEGSANTAQGGAVDGGVGEAGSAQTPSEGTSSTADATAGASADGSGTAGSADAAAGGGSVAPSAADAGSADMSAPTQPAPSFLERTGLSFDLNGHLRADIFAGKMPEYSRAVIKSGYGELGLKLRVSKAPYGDAFGEVRFKAGYFDEHYLGEPSPAPVPTTYQMESDTAPSSIEGGLDRAEFNTKVALREAYVNAYIGPHFDLRLGHQIIVWGRADGINPTNNLTPVDVRVRSPEEDDRRLGNTGLRANLNFSPVRIEGVWMPIYAPSYFPQIDLADAVRFAKPIYPRVDLQKGLFAGRFNLIFSKFEMSFSYLYGYSTQPGLSYVGFNLVPDDDDSYINDRDEVELAGDPDTNYPETVTVARTAYVQQVAGWDFATTIGDLFGLRGELAFRYPSSYKSRVYAPRPDLYYVAGVDREFGNVMIIAQYIGRYVFDWEVKPPDSQFELDLDNLDQQARLTFTEGDLQMFEENADYVLRLKNRPLHGQTEPVQHGASLRIEWRTLHDTLSLSLFGMINVSTLEWVLYPRLAYSITDAMTLSVGGEVYMGPKNTLFNYIEEILSAGYTELKVSF